MVRSCPDPLVPRPAQPRPRADTFVVPPLPIGEKITSLASYRRWLRDQAAYRRKALHGMQAAQE